MYFLHAALKGYHSKKYKFCHHLLTHKLLQTLLPNTKEDILKKYWNQTVVEHH